MGISKLTIATLLFGLGLAVCACALAGVGACLPVHGGVLETLLGSKIIKSETVGATNLRSSLGSFGAEFQTSNLPGSGWLASESLGLGARVACLGGAALLFCIALLLVVATWAQLRPLLLLYLVLPANSTKHFEAKLKDDDVQRLAIVLRRIAKKKKFIVLAVCLSLSAVVAAWDFIPDAELIAWTRARGSKLLRQEYESNVKLASAWDDAMSEFRCCGFNNASDFNTIPTVCYGPLLNSTSEPYPQGCLNKYIEILFDHKRVFIEVAFISILMLAVAVVMSSLQIYELTKETRKCEQDIYESSEDVAPLL